MSGWVDGWIGMEMPWVGIVGVIPGYGEFSCQLLL